MSGCEHFATVDEHKVRALLSEGFCPTCSQPLTPDVARRCACCGWSWRQGYADNYLRTVCALGR